MAKRRRNRQGNQRPKPSNRSRTSGSPAPVQPDTLQGLSEEIEQLNEAASEFPQPDERFEPDIPDVLSQNELRDLFAKAKHALEVSSRAKEEYERKVHDLELENERIDAKRSEVESKERDLKKLDDEVKEKTLSLNNRDLKLKLLEQDAEQGFIRKHLEIQDEFLKNLTDSGEMIDASRSKSLKEFQQHLSDWEKIEKAKMAEIFDERRKALDHSQDELDRERKQLEKERSALQDERRQVAVDSVRLEAQVEVYKEKIAALDDEVAENVEIKYGNLQDDLQAWKEVAELQGAENRRLKSEIANWQRLAIHAHGNLQDIAEQPELLLNRFRELEQERDRLRQQLANVPDSSQLAELDELRAQYEQMTGELLDKTRMISELENQLGKKRIAAIELETLRDQILALETTRDVLQQHLKELKTEVDQRIGDQEKRSPFPLCVAMDQDTKLAHPPQVTNVTDLKTFVDAARQAIAYKGFYYSEKDIRSFVAGLSMSWMTILQGISGTGKSSLPRLFAEVTGGECVTVEVQAGWRDRNDLLGYYNAFQERFYESILLQGLYRAKLPTFSDRVFVILLDEMNLSFPEQYFADFLSTMESPQPPKGRIQLIPFSDNRLRPQLLNLEQNNLSIDVPENVWFVGTANQDETTKDIADKTYDRSHVIELPSHYEEFQIGGPHSLDMVSQRSLRKAFENAKNSHQDESERVTKFLDLIREEFGRYLRIGWGNRLTKQIEDYVPVVCAAGGDWNEALDYVLTTKVLRKARDRFEVSETDLQNSLQAVSNALSKQTETGIEVDDVGLYLPKAYDFIDLELRKKGSGERGE